MQVQTAEVLFSPTTSELRFLPEGPYPNQDGIVSWVGIQHGADATVGSLNLLSLATGENRSVELVGRPGFAFPTEDPAVFVAGMERRLYRVDSNSGECEPLSDELEAGVTGTVINDGVAFADGIVFGCKDLKFEEAKAGLYLWRSTDGSIVKLRDDQTCSNGKIIRRDGDGWTLLDIDTPKQTVVRYRLDAAAGELSEAETVLDLTSEPIYPDGMIETPDGKSVVIAFYNPEDAEYGVARQIRLEDGEVEVEWRCPKAPQVTCPQWVAWQGTIKLVLTIAVEHMTADRQAVHSNSGKLFIADSTQTETAETPRVRLNGS